MHIEISIAGHVVGQMTTVDVTTDLAGTSLDKTKWDLLQSVPLVHPKSLVTSSTKARLN